MHVAARRVDGHRDRHVLHFELVDRFHAEVFERHHTRRANRLRHQVCGTTHRHQIRRLVLANRFKPYRPAFRLADHGDQSRLGQHHLGEVVHASGRGRTGWPHRFVTHGIHGTHVVDHAIGKIDAFGESFPPREQIRDALVRRVATGQELATEQQSITGRPRGHDLGRERVQVYPFGVYIRAPRDIRPVRQTRHRQRDGPAAIKREVRMTRGRAVRNHGDRLRRGVRGAIKDLHVEHGGETAKSLCADAQRVDLVAQFDAQRFDLVLWSARLELCHVDVLHERFLRHEHRLLGRSTDADAEHAWGTPASPHERHRLHDPVHDRITRVEHRKLRFILGAAALRRQLHLDRITGHDLVVHDGRRVVTRVLARERRVGHDRRAQHVVGLQVGASHAFVHHLLDRHRGVPTHVHADLEKHHHDPGILADRAMPFGAHARVGEDLRDRVFGGRALLLLVGVAQRMDVVQRMKVRDVLERVGDGLDEVRLGDGRHSTENNRARPCAASGKLALEPDGSSDEL